MFGVRRSPSKALPLGKGFLLFFARRLSHAGEHTLRERRIQQGLAVMTAVERDLVRGLAAGEITPEQVKDVDAVLDELGKVIEIRRYLEALPLFESTLTADFSASDFTEEPQ